MTTPQTRDDGLSAERLKEIRAFATADGPYLFRHKPGCPVLTAGGNPQCTCGFHQVSGKIKIENGPSPVQELLAHIDYLQSTLLSHKQQGRNEGLEEAARAAEAMHSWAEEGGEIYIVNKVAKDIRALLSPLPKPEETKE